MTVKHRTAIVTGAGGGLGRAYALFLASHGARVVVNDIGRNADGSSTAEAVANEIVEAGGEAFAHTASVTDPAEVQDMVARAERRWGGVDILINNAGILRDKSFSRMTIDEFRLVVDVHLLGAFNCTKAVWDGMRARDYGRIVMTTSCSGLYGNFGQANYGAAKMAVVGLMQTLAIEGMRNNIRVNALAPTAATAMSDGILPPDVLEVLAPERVSLGLLALVGEDAPTRTILCAGGGSFEQANITLTHGIHATSAEEVVARFDEIADRAGETIPTNAHAQGELELAKAGFAPNKENAI